MLIFVFRFEHRSWGVSDTGIINNNMFILCIATWANALTTELHLTPCNEGVPRQGRGYVHDLPRGALPIGGLPPRTFTRHGILLPRSVEECYSQDCIRYRSLQYVWELAVWHPSVQDQTAVYQEYEGGGKNMWDLSASWGVRVCVCVFVCVWCVCVCVCVLIRVHYTSTFKNTYLRSLLNVLVWILMCAIWKYITYK